MQGELTGSHESLWRQEEDLREVTDVHPQIGTQAAHSQNLKAGAQCAGVLENQHQGTQGGEPRSKKLQGVLQPQVGVK